MAKRRHSEKRLDSDYMSVEQSRKALDTWAARVGIMTGTDTANTVARHNARVHTHELLRYVYEVALERGLSEEEARKLAKCQVGEDPEGVRAMRMRDAMARTRYRAAMDDPERERRGGRPYKYDRDGIRATMEAMHAELPKLDYLEVARRIARKDGVPVRRVRYYTRDLRW